MVTSRATELPSSSKVTSESWIWALDLFEVVDSECFRPPTIRFWSDFSLAWFEFTIPLLEWPQSTTSNYLYNSATTTWWSGSRFWAHKSWAIPFQEHFVGKKYIHLTEYFAELFWNWFQQKVVSVLDSCKLRERIWFQLSSWITVYE